ncbi:MAG: hypothetical protein K2R98_31595 [Gemmataceae bacterium]|nr:hypothetical protein [Gemmataceae bacterium]
MTDPLYGLTAEAGLHVLKDRWCQKAYLETQCAELAKNLAIALDKTASPDPRQSYFGGSRDDRVVRLRESQWERGLWQWSKRNQENLAGCWHCILAYQVPLFSKQKKEGWGYIDLLGIDDDGTLAVLELKKEPGRSTGDRTTNSESPLRMVLEAAAYAAALRKSWSPFRFQLADYLRKNAFDEGLISRLPQKLTLVRLVGVAPAEYWMDWLPVTPKGLTVSATAWDAFRHLLSALERAQLPTTFVSLVGDPSRPATLKARWLKGFPVG